MKLSYFDLTAIVAPVPPDWNGVSELKNGPLKKAAVQLLLAGPPHRLEIPVSYTHLRAHETG